MKKKDNGEVYKFRKTSAVLHLFLCLLEDGLAHGWLLNDVVSSRYTKATKRAQTVDLFRLIIVLVSLHVATSYLDSNFLFLYIV